MKTYRSANPMIWGAIVAVGAAVIAVVGSVMHDPSPNTLLQDPWHASGVGFGFGFMIAMFRNWLNERHTGP